MSMPGTEQSVSSPEESLPSEPHQRQSGVFPNVNISTADWSSVFQRVGKSGLFVTEILGNYYFCLQSEDVPGQGIESTELLFDAATSKAISLSYPANFLRWTVGSGSSVVLQGRYLYEWRSYTSQFEESDEHDVKLTRVDGNTGKVEVVDEVKQVYPFVYLCSIDEERFLSYCVSQAPSDKAEYATLTVATVYHSDGTKQEIVREKYENDASWSNSEGILIERFAVKDGEIYGFGRRRISNEYKFFLYHYDETGKLLDTQAVSGFENIIGDEQPLELILIGDFIAYRTWESLTGFISKRTDNGTELVVGSGVDTDFFFAISDNYIFFIERNINDDATIKDEACPLYAIEVESGKIKAIDFPVPLETPYHVDFKALSNGDILVTYCDDGKYDPLKLIQFILPSEKLEVLFEAAE